jgi:hypothetical protein
MEMSLGYKSVAEIWRSAEFRRNYVFYPIQVEGGWYYNLYRRLDTPRETVPPSPRAPRGQPPE